MNPVDAAVCTPEWLALREEADAEARSAELPGYLGEISGVIRDLGCGTGSMTRWLAPRLPGPSRWVLQDSDPILLEHARTDTLVPFSTVCADATELRVGDLAGTGLVTASALFDLLTAEEADAIARACRLAGCAALCTLTVTGEVTFDPPEALDAEFARAFNDHQRRTVAGRRLLGPDAPEHLARAFGRVLSRPSPWRLGANRPELTRAWLDGWLSAATAQRPDLAEHVEAYRRRRLTQCAAGELGVTVGHLDVLHLPDGSDS